MRIPWMKYSDITDTVGFIHLQNLVLISAFGQRGAKRPDAILPSLQHLPLLKLL